MIVLKYFAGYSFGWPKCVEDIKPWVHGVVVTPRYTDKLRGEKDASGDKTPVIIDNGAWSAYLSGTPLGMREQLEGLHRVSDAFEEVQFVITPDVVGDPVESLNRIQSALPLMDRWRPSQRLLVVQDGADIRELMSFIEAGKAGGLFVGGKSQQWKLATTKEIRQYCSDVYLHVGRVSSRRAMREVANAGADSIDNTSFTRKTKNNVNADYELRLRLYCERK